MIKFYISVYTYYIIGSACPYICTRTMRSLYTQSGAVPLSTPVREAAGGCTLLISRTISKWFTLSVCKIAAIQIRLARRATEKRRAKRRFSMPTSPWSSRSSIRNQQLSQCEPMLTAIVQSRIFSGSCPRW